MVPYIDKLVRRGGADMNRALQEELGFKIPITDLDYVTQFPDAFEYGKWTHSGSVVAWLDHNLIDNSEYSVISLDSNWEGILQGFLPGLTFFRDQHGPSSDLTIVHKRCIVLKAEAKKDEKDMEEEVTLTNKFQGKAYKMFPVSSAIIGVCSSATLIKIFKISYNHELKQYESALFANGEYRVEFLQERVRFLVDIMKLLRWIYTVNQPLESFQLIPNVRTPTNNHHYVTWNGIAIIKEFNGKVSIDLKHIEKVYKASLPNVGHGEVIAGVYPLSIRIYRIGKTLTQAISNGFNKDTAYRHIQAGLEQLRELDLGHGDIKMNNIFVDDNDVAFLDDLEYCAPLGTIIPKERRPANITNVRNIEEFDAWRLGQLKLDLAKM